MSKEAILKQANVQTTLKNLTINLKTIIQLAKQGNRCHQSLTLTFKLISFPERQPMSLIKDLIAKPLKKVTM